MGSPRKTSRALCGLSWVSLALIAGLCIPVSVQAQEARKVTTPTDWAWKPVLALDGVLIEYIFFPEKEGGQEGVVLKIVNNNDFGLHYRFTVILRSLESVFEKDVEGSIEAQSLLTGDNEGLFWAPFEGSESIGEIGIRGFKTEREQ